MGKTLTLTGVAETASVSRMDLVDEFSGDAEVCRPMVLGADLSGVPKDRDILLWCGRWCVGRLVQYGRFVGDKGVLNPTHWAECPGAPV